MDLPKKAYLEFAGYLSKDLGRPVSELEAQLNANKLLELAQEITKNKGEKDDKTSKNKNTLQRAGY